MPAIAAHYLFGQEVYKRLIQKNRKDIIALLRKHKPDYNLGLQGPDPLMYNKPTVKHNPVFACSKRIHEEPANLFFRNAAHHIRETRDIRAFVYAMGFVNHYVLDRESHSVVNELAPDISGHMKLETELDRELLLREILDRDAKHRKEKYIQKHKEEALVRKGFKLFRGGQAETALYFPLQFYSPKPSVKPEKIQRYKFIQYEKDLEKSIAPFYPELKEKQVKSSLDSFIKYTKLLHSPNGANAVVLKHLQTMVTGQDTFSALAMTGRRRKDYEDSARKLVPIFDASAPLAADMLINFHDSVRFRTALSDYFEQNFG